MNNWYLHVECKSFVNFVLFLAFAYLCGALSEYGGHVHSCWRTDWECSARPSCPSPGTTHQAYSGAWSLPHPSSEGPSTNHTNQRDRASLIYQYTVKNTCTITMDRCYILFYKMLYFKNLIDTINLSKWTLFVQCKLHWHPFHLHLLAVSCYQGSLFCILWI